MTARHDRAATDAPVEGPASVAARYNFADEVSAVLTAALARDDARRRRLAGHPGHCPHCGKPLFLESLT